MAITIPIITDFNASGINKATKSFKQLETNGQKAAFAVRKAAIPAGLALAGLAVAGLDAAKAAMEDAAASDLLAGQLRRVTGASDAAVASAEDYITALSMQVGIADDQLRPALGKLATATGDVSRAQDLLGIALDVSAQTSKPLEAVTAGLAKAYGGNLGALKKLIPGFDEAIIKSKDFEKAQDELAKLTGGAAAASADTAAGKFRTLGVSLDEAKEAIGAALLPAINAVLPMLQSLAKYAQENSGVILALGIAVGSFAAAILVTNAVMAAARTATLLWTGAQVLLNVALAANPIGIVLIALAAVAAALVLAYKNSGTFREAVAKLGEVAQAVFGWLRENVGPIVEVIVKAFKIWAKPIEVIISGLDKIKSVLGSIFGGGGGNVGQSQALKDLADQANKAENAVKKIPASVAAAIRSARTTLGGTVASIAQMVGTRAGAPKSAEADALQRQLDGENAIREKAGLEAAITSAETDQDKARAQLALDQFVTQAKIQSLRDEAAAASTSATERVTALNAQYQNGLITAQAFQNQLNGIIGESAGTSMGEGFALAFATGLEEIRVQLLELQTIKNEALIAVGLPTPTGIKDAAPKKKKKKKKKMATGGIVTSATDVTIGEAGPEAVIPLNRARGFGVGGITINVQAGLVSTPDQIGQQIIEAIQNAQRRSGPVFAAA